MADALKPREVTKGTEIITQGSEGQEFFIIEEGSQSFFFQPAGSGGSVNGWVGACGVRDG